MLALALLAGGCTDDGASVDGSPEVAEPEAIAVPELPGPGSPLLDDFVLPEGTRQVGPVQPFADHIYNEQTPDSNWEVDFVVDVDPRLAVDDFLEQARAQGLDVRSHCEVDGENVMCRAKGRRILDGFVDVQVKFWAGRDERSQEGSISYLRWPAGVYPADNLFRPGPVHSGAWAPAEPLDLPPAELAVGAPAVGEPLLQQDGGPEIDVVEGSVVVGPVTLLEEDWYDGFEALLYVPGDVGPVIEAYVAQMHPRGPLDRFDEGETVQGIDTVRVGIDEGEGGDLIVRAILGEGGRGNWLQLNGYRE